ncbi:hypothetical protein KCA24_36675, partial [Escherichia coli]|nr:hypothetical protein [Escherichia coli]
CVRHSGEGVTSPCKKFTTSRPLVTPLLIVFGGQNKRLTRDFPTSFLKPLGGEKKKFREGKAEGEKKKMPD